MTKEPTTRFIVVPVTDPEVDTLLIQECFTVIDEHGKHYERVAGHNLPVPEDDTLQEDVEDVTRRLDDILSGAMVPLTDPMFDKINRIRVRFDLESFA